MRKRIILIATHLLLFQIVSAQDQVSCAQLLEDAKEAYGAGMVELVPELLNDCIESGLSGSSKQEAYVLVITAYLFDYLPNEADALMEHFLDEFPNFQAKPSDPSEFTILLNKHKEQRAELQTQNIRQQQITTQTNREAEARQEQLRQQELKKLKRSQKQGNKSSPGLGFTVGTNLSIPQLIEPYSITDPSLSDGKFGVATPGFHIGAELSLPISNAIEASVELQYERVRFNFTETPFSFTAYTYDEFQNRLALPLSFLFHMNPDSDNKFYFRIGVVTDYLLSASASGIRNYTDSESQAPDAVVDITEITSARSRMNVSLLGGMGMKFSMQSGFIFIETIYQYGLLQGNVESERYSNQDLVWMLYHVDGDFKLHQLNISAGMVFYLK